MSPWCDVTPKELMVFFDLKMLMVIIIKTEERFCWYEKLMLIIQYFKIK